MSGVSRREALGSSGLEFKLPSAHAARVCDGCTLDAFTLDEDCFGPAEVDVGRGEIVEAFVIADVVVVLDEGVDLLFEIAGQIVVLK